MAELLARQAIEERIAFENRLALLVFLLRRAGLTTVDFQGSNRERDRDLIGGNVRSVGMASRVSEITAVGRHRNLIW